MHSLMERSAMEGAIKSPWRGSMVKVEGKRFLMWKPLAQIALNPILCEVGLMECLTMQRVMLPKERQMEKMVVWIGWSLKVETKALLPFDKSPSIEHSIIMNILVWNCRGVLKPSFQNHVMELIWCHNPAILVVMETKIGGERAREITDRLPFDGSIHTETIGYADGLWML